MSQPIPANTTEPILCPYENRRTSAELYVKFFMVSFTTIGFYLHLIRRRDGTYLSWSPFLFFVAPLNLIFRYFIASLGIFGFLGTIKLRDYVRGQPQPDHWETIKPSLRWLLGTARVDGYSTLPTTDSDSNTQHSEISIPSLFGKFVVNGVFITQCAGSIYLYRRRQQRDANTMIDQKIFELACAGLLVGLLNLALSFELPIFRDPVPEGEEKSGLDRFALTCRDSCRSQLLPWDEKTGYSTEEGSHGVRFGKNVVIATLIWMIFSSSEFTGAWRNMASAMRDRYHEDPTGIYIFSPLLFILLVVAPCFYSVYSILEIAKWKGVNITRTHYILLGCACPVIWPLSIILWLALMFIAFNLIFTISIWFFGSIAAIAEVSSLSDLPQNVTCPQLWSDPVSEWIVWLA